MMKHHVRQILASLLVVAAGATTAGAQAAQSPAPPRPVAPSSDVPPAGATGRCRDGSFSTSESVSTDCATHGGMLVSFPIRRAPQRPANVATQSGSVAASATPLLKPASAERPKPLAASHIEEAPKVLTGSAPGAPPRAQKTSGIVADPIIMARPANATGQCKDGSYLVGSVNESSCGANGGLAAKFPEERVAAPSAASASASPAAASPSRRAQPAPSRRGRDTKKP